MNYSLDYYSTYGPSGKIYVRCVGGEDKCKIRYYLYDSQGFVKRKTAYNDELVMFYYPCPSTYRVYADIYPEGCDKIELSTEDIRVATVEHFPPEVIEIKPIKGPLSLVEGQDNYLIVKFIKGGLKKLRNELSSVVPVYYQVRHVIKFVPTFDKAVLDKIKKYSPELASFRYEYIVHPQIDQQLLLDLGNELQQLDYVEYCDLKGVLGAPIPEAGEPVPEPEPPAPANTLTPDFSGRQGHLFGNNSLHVQPVWNRGISGQNMIVHVVDTGIFPQHEDLSGIVERSGTTLNPDHGTASAGVVMGRNNGFGIIGIAYSARAQTYNNQDIGMIQMMEEAHPGDVVTISLGAVANGISMPIIHNRNNWDRIRNIVSSGVNVVIAAGNGGHNLTHPPFNNHGNSGAIIVAASHPVTGRRLHFSNFNAWNIVNARGSDVATCGYGDMFNPGNVNRRYTANYNGTSAATPLVAGVMTLIQSYARLTYHRIFTNPELFMIIHNTGTRLAESDMIGRRPIADAAINYVDELLGNASSTSDQPPPDNQGRYPRWEPDRLYITNQRVSWNNANWSARWDIRGVEPGTQDLSLPHRLFPWTNLG